MSVSDFTASAMKNLPAETRIVKKVYWAMKKNGTPVDNVFDGEEYVPVSSLDETLEAVFSVDISRMYHGEGTYALIVLGNEWDALSDYTMDLDTALDPVHKYIDQQL